MTPEVFRLQWQNDAASRVRLTRLLQEQIDLTEGHSAWGGFCEEVGEDELALREYRLTLRDHPDDVEALSRLAALLPEIGQMEEAGRCIEKWFQAMPGSAEALEAMVGFLLEADLPERALEVLERAAGAGQRLSVLDPLRARIRAHQKAGESEPSEPPPPPGALNDSDVVRFAHLFSGRENLYARQWWDESGQGGYTPVQQPFTFAVARNHLLGSVTVGVYPVRLDSTVNFVAFDIDINKRALERARGDLEETRRLKELIRREAARLIEALREIGMTPILEDSGYKGRHIWLFLESPVEAAVARQFGMIFMTVHPLQARELHTEFFPKQAEVGTGVGNLIKLPLGIHRRSGRRSRLLLADGSVDHEPHESLRRVTRLSHQLLFEAITRLKERAPALPSPQGVEQPESEETVGLPSPPELPPAWTSAHFETDPEVSQLLAHCAVLRDLKNQVEGTRRLSYDEQVVLAHSLGHSPAGVLAVNYLLDQCVNVGPGSRLQSPHSGNPISCPKIRKRIPQVTARVPCNCLFDFAPDQYPNPRLHLLRPASKPVGPPAQPAGAWDPVEAVKAWGVLKHRREALENELRELEARLLKHLEQSGAPCIEVSGGAMVLCQEEGAPPALKWEVRTAPPPEETHAITDLDGTGADAGR